MRQRHQHPHRPEWCARHRADGTHGPQDRSGRPKRIRVTCHQQTQTVIGLGRMRMSAAEIAHTLGMAHAPSVASSPAPD